MRSWLEHIDNYSIDDQLYWHVPVLAGEGQYEIQWRRSVAFAWRFRKVGSLFWQECTTENLEAALQLEGVDLTTLASSIEQSVVQQAVFAKIIYDKTQALVGKDTLESASRAHFEFLNELREAVDEIQFLHQEEMEVVPNQARVLRLVKVNSAD